MVFFYFFFAALFRRKRNLKILSVFIKKNTYYKHESKIRIVSGGFLVVTKEGY